MSEEMRKVVSAIEAQQAKAERYSTIWTVGEQLKDMLRREPQHAELIAQDLENASMSLAECEKKIKALADERHKKARGGVGVSPMEAGGIIRKFYGLPERDAEPAADAAPKSEGGEVIDLAEFF